MPLEMGHVGSKSRSLGQILEKSCVHSKSHIFSPINMKLSQNVYFEKDSDETKIGSCQVTRSNLRKTLCTL